MCHCKKKNPVESMVNVTKKSIENYKRQKRRRRRKGRIRKESWKMELPSVTWCSDFRVLEWEQHSCQSMGLSFNNFVEMGMNPGLHDVGRWAWYMIALLKGCSLHEKVDKKKSTLRNRKIISLFGLGSG